MKRIYLCHACKREYIRLSFALRHASKLHHGEWVISDDDWWLTTNSTGGEQ